MRIAKLGLTFFFGFMISLVASAQMIPYTITFPQAASTFPMENLDLGMGFPAAHSSNLVAQAVLDCKLQKTIIEMNQALIAQLNLPISKGVVPGKMTSPEVLQFLQSALTNLHSDTVIDIFFDQTSAKLLDTPDFLSLLEILRASAVIDQEAAVIGTGSSLVIRISFKG